MLPMSKRTTEYLMTSLDDVKTELIGGNERSWSDSPYLWIRNMQSGRKGKAGEKIIEKWLRLEGLKVTQSINGESDRSIEGKEIEIKTSTLWERGVLVFQQMRDQDYEYVLFLGVLPDKLLLWSVPKNVALEHSEPQHSGKGGNDTKWLIVDAFNTPEWLKPYGGSFSSGLSVMKKQLNNCLKKD